MICNKPKTTEEEKAELRALQIQFDDIYMGKAHLYICTIKSQMA